MKLLLIMLTVLGCIAQTWYWQTYPEVIASHFAAGGQANGWMTRELNLVFSVGMLVLMCLMFVNIPALLNRTPVRLISFPNRDFWFSDERKQQTLTVIAIWFHFYGALVVGFLVLIFHLVYLANQQSPPQLNEQLFIPVFSGFIIATFIWVLALYRRFRKPGNH